MLNNQEVEQSSAMRSGAGQEMVTDRNVYILGAGFSACAGAPLLHDFLDRARMLMDDPSSDLDDFERDTFREVFKFRQTVAQAREKVILDLDNIEQLFGLVAISGRLGRLSSNTWESTVHLIAKTLELEIERNRRRAHLRFGCGPAMVDRLLASGVFQKVEGISPPQVQADIYDFFTGLITGILDQPERRHTRSNAVITFNYDLVLDAALMRLGIEPNYHLKQVNDSAEDRSDTQQNFPILKLHGSCNWAICTTCKRTQLVFPQKITEHSVEMRALICANCGKKAYQPLLIPPSWDKTEYQSIMTPVWTKAVEELESATRVFIIGYSMPETDAFFKYLLTLALSRNHGLYKLSVVDYDSRSRRNLFGSESKPPLPHPVEMRYRELLDPLFQKRRFSFYSEGLEGFLRNKPYVEIGRGEILREGVSLF